MDSARDAILLGGAIASLPTTLTILYPGLNATRHAVALAQALFSLLFVYLTGDSAIANYHIFVSLVLLTLFRDERVLATNALTVALGLGLMAPAWEWLARAGEVGLIWLLLRSLCRNGTANPPADDDSPPTSRSATKVTESVPPATDALGREGLATVLLDQAPDGIVCFSDEGRIETANAAAAALLGLAADAIPGRPISEFLPGLEIVAGRHSLRACLPESGDSSGRCSVPVEVSLARAKVGRQRRWIAILRDATERQKSEGALQSAREMAEAAARAKTEFLANMSHEVRTPLTAILGFAELALEQIGSNGSGNGGASSGAAALQSALETVRRNGEHLLAIINDILDISRIETGQLRVDRVECSALQVVADVIARVRGRAEARGLALHTKVAAPMPDLVRTDPTRLRQILLTLLGNAIRFTERGSVRLEAWYEPTQAPVGGKLHFTVTDSGIGIGGTRLEYLFEPFSQVEGAPDRRIGGAGMGLAIAKHLAERLGGAIAVTSVPESGSTFHVWIATGDVRHATMVTDPGTALAGQRGGARRTAIRIAGRVLLAEDGPDNQHLIRVVLGKAGLQVDAVSNGRAAVERTLAALAQGNPYDVILMDMQMPEMDGYESTQRLRLEGYTGSIIALTAHALAKDRQKCLEAGCDDYVAKPIDREALLRAIEARVARPVSVPSGA